MQSGPIHAKKILEKKFLKMMKICHILTTTAQITKILSYLDSLTKNTLEFDQMYFSQFLTPPCYNLA